MTVTWTWLSWRPAGGLHTYSIITQYHGRQKRLSQPRIQREQRRGGRPLPQSQPSMEEINATARSYSWIRPFNAIGGHEKDNLGCWRTCGRNKCDSRTRAPGSLRGGVDRPHLGIEGPNPTLRSCCRIYFFHRRPRRRRTRGACAGGESNARSLASGPTGSLSLSEEPPVVVTICVGGGILLRMWKRATAITGVSGPRPGEECGV